MFFLIATVIIGAGLALLATQNTVGVPVRIGPYTWESLPLYGVALATLLFGLFIAWVLSIFGWAANSLLLRGKEQRIRSTESTVHTLEQRIHELEEENSVLKTKLTTKKDLHEDNQPNPLERIRHSFS